MVDIVGKGPLYIVVEYENRASSVQVPNLSTFEMTIVEPQGVS